MRKWLMESWLLPGGVAVLFGSTAIFLAIFQEYATALLYGADWGMWVALSWIRYETVVQRKLMAETEERDRKFLMESDLRWDSWLKRQDGLREQLRGGGPDILGQG